MLSELPLTFPQQLRKVQAAREDFEWYPTTDEIIAALVRDVKRHVGSDGHRYRHSGPSNNFLDIGAGNGKVINAIKDLEFISDTFAIEKSATLQEMLPASTFILGCDFWKTSLIDKDVGIIFSNPPYSTYQDWTLKILREIQPGSVVYLVIPDRWEKSEAITREIKARKATTKVLGTYDFQAAEEREARARVHLLRVELLETQRHYRDPENVMDDPFTRFFHETFTYPEAEEEIPFDTQLEQAQIVHRLNFIEALCRLHDLRIEQLQRNYQAVCELSAEILAEFDINKGGLIKSLKMKLDTCKKEYWRRLFDGMKEINTRLTAQSRETIQRKLQAQTGIDFNRDNCYAVVLWTVKNANQYFDTQLVETYEKMVESANVDNYVSNKRIFKWNRFAYRSQIEEKATHYRLKVGHRMVLNSVGGLRNYHSWETGISKDACDFLGDLITVAHNLGFAVIDSAPTPYSFNDSSARVIRFRTADGTVESLIRTRAFQNNNMHMQFHPDFIHALNVHHGRLKGWLRNDDDAATELEIPKATAAKLFATPGFRLTSSSLSLMAPVRSSDTPVAGIHSFTPPAEEKSPPLRLVTPERSPAAATAFADF